MTPGVPGATATTPSAALRPNDRAAHSDSRRPNAAPSAPDIAIRRDRSPTDFLADGEFARGFLSGTIPELRSGAWRLLSCQVTEVRRRGRGGIVCYQLSYRNGADYRVRTTELVAKVVGRRDHGAKTLGTLRQLWEAGFRPPGRYRVPRPYAHAPRQATLLQAKALGAAWAGFLRADEQALAAASARAAAWLIRLQRSPVRAEASGWEGDAAWAHRLARTLVSTFPASAPRLEPLAGRLMHLLPREGQPLVPSHGDYHPGNVFLSPGLTTVIDLDHFGLREPAFDVGYAIGQLLIMSYMRVGDFGTGARGALALWRRYRRGGQAAWPRVGVQAARTFLQSLHYELCTLRTNRVELLGLWPDLMERFLESDGPGTLEDLIRRR